MQAGQTVHARQVIGLLQAGPVFLPVVAPQRGVVLSISAAAGSMVGYGAAICTMAIEGD
jgi:biotin carboxyl carrier protein